MLLSEHQFGYRKKLSTSSAINALQNSILSAFEENKYVGGLFCDLHKAFDTVNHKILLAKLRYYGISSSPYKLIESYLVDRYQRVEITNKLNKKVNSSWERIQQAVPQGSVLGTLLFLIYI